MGRLFERLRQKAITLAAMKLSFLKCETPTFEIWQVGAELHELLLQLVYVDAMHVVAMRGAEDGGGHAGGLTRDIAARHYTYGGLHMSVRTDARYALPPPCSSAPFLLPLPTEIQNGSQELFLFERRAYPRMLAATKCIRLLMLRTVR